MRYLKEYKLWEQSKELTKNQVDFLNRSIMPLQSVNPVPGTWSVNSEGLVDVDGNFDCARGGLNNFQGIRFGKISGSFNCSENSLSSLEGAPREVRWNFYCSENNLISLEGAPLKVGGNFYCHRNQLVSLKGAPQEVGGNFDCSENHIISLEGGTPLKVRGNFYCRENPISKKTINFIRQVMKENPNIQYGIILNLIQNKISKRDWDKLDKSSMEGMTDGAKKAYKLLAGIGGI